MAKLPCKTCGVVVVGVKKNELPAQCKKHRKLVKEINTEKRFIGQSKMRRRIY